MDSSSRKQIDVRIDDRPRGRIAWVAIDNPARLNAMNAALMDEFVAVFADLARDEDLRAVVLTGAGERAFVGGADIDEMAALTGPEAARTFITRVHACCEAVRALPAPVIARIQGFCFGAGLELAAACDFRVAAESAQLGMPEVRLGIPSVVEAALLPGLIGWGRTRQILLTGESFSARQALDWKLVEAVVPAAELDAAVETWLGQLLACAPGAVRRQKSLIRAWEDLPMQAAIAAGVDAFAAAYETPEPAAVMAEFLAIRLARKGRN
jgi:enoyl-CoA hydratase/carnithine racemase